MLGISTCWWDTSFIRADEILSDILDLGFQGVELEYRISNSLYQEMRPHLNKELKVLSIHNFFPKPEDKPTVKGSGDFFLLSSTDRDERATAVKHSIRTIEYAHDLEAQAVVLHLGHVDMENTMERFRELHRNGEIHQDAGQAFLDEQRTLRQSKCAKNLDAVLFSLEGLNREAVRRGVYLGIENRYHFREIPDIEEIGIILREFEGGNVRYWHDVGHAAVQEQLGITAQKVLLDAYAEKMLGIHFHDARGLDDHFAPGQGDMDFTTIIPFVKRDCIKVLEIHPKVERKQLLEGVQFIETALRQSASGP